MGVGPTLTGEPEGAAEENHLPAEPAIVGEPAVVVEPEGAAVAFPAPAEPAIVGDESSIAPSAPASTPARRSKGAVVAIWLLGLALVLVLAAGAWLVVQFIEAQEQISDQKNRISEQDDEIEQQKELIEQKDTFGAAMNGLLDTVAQFEGAMTTSVVPWDKYQVLVNRAWAHRWDAEKLAADTEQVDIAAEQIGAVWASAQQEVGSNATGTTSTLR